MYKVTQVNDFEQLNGCNELIFYSRTLIIQQAEDDSFNTEEHLSPKCALKVSLSIIDFLMHADVINNVLGGTFSFCDVNDSCQRPKL